MKHLVLSFLILLVSSVASAAGTLTAAVQVGAGKSILDSKQFERMGAVSLRYGNTIGVKVNGGYWYAPAPGDRPSLFGSVQFSAEVVGDGGGTFAQVEFGPAYIQNDDAKLSGHFQFELGFGVGVKTSNGFSIAGKWKHWSNAGLLKDRPNLGRDIICIELGIPIYSWGLI